MRLKECDDGRGQPLHCRLAKIRGLMRRVKYGAVIGQKGTHNLVIPTGHIQKNAFSDQSQRRIQPFSSNHGFSPNDDSVNYSAVVDPSHDEAFIRPLALYRLRVKTHTANP